MSEESEKRLILAGRAIALAEVLLKFISPKTSAKEAYKNLKAEAKQIKNRIKKLSDGNAGVNVEEYGLRVYFSAVNTLNNATYLYSTHAKELDSNLLVEVAAFHNTSETVYDIAEKLKDIQTRQLEFKAGK
jgi:hypothetical protein